MHNKIKVLIEYIPSTKGSIDYEQVINNLPQGNNNSNPSALNTAHIGRRGFVLGASKLGSGDKFVSKQDKYPGFMGRQLSDINGVYTPPVQFTLVGTDINNFTIRFDKAAKQFATIINVDGTDYNNNNEVFTWSGLTSNVHKIQIKQWNTPLFPIRITSILVGLTIEYNNSQIRNVIAGSQSTFDNTKPNFNVVNQYGRIDIVDTDDRILQLAEMQLLRANLPIYIFLNAPEKNLNESQNDYMARIKSYMIGNYRSSEWSINYGNSFIQVTLNDEIENWNNTLFGGVVFETARTVYDLLSIILNHIHKEIQLPVYIKEHLQSIRIGFGYLSISNLREAIEKICNIGKINIFNNIKGDLTAL